MWIAFAFGAAVFAGLTAILAKIGIRNTDSNLATAVRTIVVLAAAWGMVWIVGSAGTITQLSQTTLVFLVLSGLATGASWLCYFRALQIGDVNRVAPVDRSSLVLTVLFAIIFLGETNNLVVTLIGVAIIAVGTAFMVGRIPPRSAVATGHSWLVYAIGAAVFAALTTILGKVGIEGVESNLGTAIRTSVVLVMAWVVVAVTRRTSSDNTSRDGVPPRDLLFIVLSGLATAASWLCYYRALQDGPASVVAPIDKLSILFTVAFSSWVLKEHLRRWAAIGLALIVIGTLVLLL